MHIYIYIHTYIYIYVYVYVYTHTHINMYMCMYTYMCIYIVLLLEPRCPAVLRNQGEWPEREVNLHKRSNKLPVGNKSFCAIESYL